MKIKVISRDETENTKEKTQDTKKEFFSKNSKIHNLEKPREFIRALNSAKIQKIYAKPFLMGLTGHSDTVISLAKHPHNLINIITGSCDGEVFFFFFIILKI
jgi:DDB1- and CUL4-associated factor 13